MQGPSTVAPRPTRWPLGLAVALFSAVFMASRLAHLTALPVFLDEATHLDAARRIATKGDLFQVPPGGGKYLITWIYAVTTAESSNPLWMGRCLSALFGLATALGLWALGRITAGEQAGALAAVLYLFTPFALAYDRMAMMDGPLTAMTVLALLAGFRWTAAPTPARGLGLGVAIGLAALTKLSGLLLLLMPLFLLVGADGPARRRLVRSLPLVYATLLLVLSPMLVDLVPRMDEVMSVWILRAPPKVSQPPLVELRDAFDVFVRYLTPGGALLVGGGALLAMVRRQGVDLILLAVSLAWLLAVMSGGPNWYPRYLLPIVPPLLLVLARQACALARPFVAWAMALAFAASAVSFDLRLLTDPATAPWPILDAWQHVWGQPSGYGLAEAHAFLRADVHRNGPLIVLRDFHSGPLVEGLDLLSRTGGRLETVQLDLEKGCMVPGASVPEGRFYLVVEAPVGGRTAMNLGRPVAFDLLAAFPRPKNVRELRVYRVSGPPSPEPCRRLTEGRISAFSPRRT